MPSFVPGLELSKRFYVEAVRPVLEKAFPGVPYSAALLGAGSEVFGYDTGMSTDHDWGPRVLLFLPEDDLPLTMQVAALLSDSLPATYGGYRVLRPVAAPEEHLLSRTYVGPLSTFVWQSLAYDVRQPLEMADWLSIPSQALREMIAGMVFHDGLGTLAPLRERLAYYPRDVWLYMLAADWQRIGQEEHLMPRAGHVGDELGSAIIGSRLVRDAMHLAFLVERRYPPYPKWFGRAFRELAGAEALLPLLWQVQQASTWSERQEALVAVWEYLARMHNALGITERLTPEADAFYDRPFQVIGGERYARALCAEIVDPAVRSLLGRPLIGSVDQWSDNTDLKACTLRRSVRGLYEG